MLSLSAIQQYNTEQVSCNNCQEHVTLYKSQRYSGIESYRCRCGYNHKVGSVKLDPLFADIWTQLNKNVVNGNVQSYIADTIFPAIVPSDKLYHVVKGLCGYCTDMREIASVVRSKIGFDNLPKCCYRKLARCLKTKYKHPAIVFKAEFTPGVMTGMFCAAINKGMKEYGTVMYLGNLESTRQTVFLCSGTDGHRPEFVDCDQLSANLGRIITGDRGLILNLEHIVSEERYRSRIHQRLQYSLLGVGSGDNCQTSTTGMSSQSLQHAQYRPSHPGLCQRIYDHPPLAVSVVPLSV